MDCRIYCYCITSSRKLLFCNFFYCLLCVSIKYPLTTQGNLFFELLCEIVRLIHKYAGLLIENSYLLFLNFLVKSPYLFAATYSTLRFGEIFQGLTRRLLVSIHDFARFPPVARRHPSFDSHPFPFPPPLLPSSLLSFSIPARRYRRY